MKFYDIHNVCRLWRLSFMMFVPFFYDVCRIMTFVGYDVCRIMMFVAYDIFECAAYRVCHSADIFSFQFKKIYYNGRN